MTVVTYARGEAICLARIERLMDAQQRLLDDVLGLGDAAEHPVGDPEGQRPQLIEQLLRAWSCHLASLRSRR